MLCRLLYTLIPHAAASLCAFPSPQQQVLSSERETGTLLRFHYNNSHGLQEVVRAATDHSLDIWQVTRAFVDIYSPPQAEPLPGILQAHSHTTTEIDPKAHKIQPSPYDDDWDLTSLENSTFHAAYHPLYEIDAFAQELAALHPHLVRVSHLGHTGQGREMLALTISRSEARVARKEKEKPKMGFVIMGAQHAREWVATAASMYIAHALVANASEQHSLSGLLDSFDFHIIPSPNPDGYDYTWESDRFWYKNRMTTAPKAKCVGLDMNRNWGFKWKPEAVEHLFDSTCPSKDFKPKGPKIPADPCSHWYPGNRPFEAPEVNNIANYISTLPDLMAFIDLRSYGQMFSSPYSYSCKRLPKDAEDQLEAAQGAVHALRLSHGTTFVTGTLCSLLYRAPGNIVDWMYARAGIKYAYAAHLRDTGTYGFALPPEWIRPVGEETVRMIEYLARFIIKNKK